MAKQKKETMASQGEPAAKTHATIQISLEHERAIQEAIEGGVVRSADEIIEIALTMLSNPQDEKERIPGRKLSAVWKSLAKNTASARANQLPECGCMKATVTDGGFCT
jgi:Arc/MetJ-type ribon-helix-helix transcriptional regulator